MEPSRRGEGRADPRRLWPQLPVPSYGSAAAQARKTETDKGSPVGWGFHPSPLLFPFCSPISGTTGRTGIRNGA